MDYSLRSAVPNDFEFVKYIHHETLREYVEPLWGWDEKYQDEQIREMFVPEKFFIVQVQNKDVGILVTEDKGTDIFLASISIIPSFQRKGLGKKIVLDVMKKAEAENKYVSLQVLRTNHLAKKLYLGLGFKPAGETEFSYQLSNV